MVAAASIGNWLISNSQHASARDSARNISRTGDMLEAMLAGQLALERFETTRDANSTVTTIEQEHAKLQAALAYERSHVGNNAERQLIGAQAVIQSQWLGLSLRLIRKHDGSGAVLRLSPQRALLHSFTDANERLSDVQIVASNRAQDHAKQLSLWLMVLALLLLSGVVVTSLARDRSWRREMRFQEMLSASRSEEEAYALLRRHLERALRGVRATVLGRNNSANRLELRTPAPQGLPLTERLQDATPDSCLALRLARPHTRRPRANGLLTCEICGAEESPTLCAPLIVGGKVMGSVLVARKRRFTKRISERLAEMLLLAAPAIANQRNLAIAKQRAATDALTGLPNRRSGDEALKSMVALAARTDRPLAAAMLDIDHFKHVNDTYGHEKGDQLLAAIGDMIAGSLRESDFACRYGGEEFLILLPDTNRDGAVELAEKLRVSVAGLRSLGGVSSVNASLGVAVLPDDAIDFEQLVRSADRALYLAKRLGRNRVEPAASGSENEQSLSAVVDGELTAR
jgi:diguanylate cyclase (GGDEF)-like protein